MDSIFLFAHQDDEYGIFHFIRQSVVAGDTVYCAYLTDGGPQAKRRNAESLAVLKTLGVSEKNVFFAGEDMGIMDGALFLACEKAARWIKGRLLSRGYVKNIYIPAWEGGHPDHDALHAVAVSLAEVMGIQDCVRQYPLYNGYRCSGAFFRVMLPLLENGAVDTVKIPLWGRCQFLWLCLRYPSQWKTWLGLFPFVFLHFLFWGTQATQPTTLERIGLRPHTGELYYERRNFCTWEKFSSTLQTYDLTSSVGL